MSTSKTKGIYLPTTVVVDIADVKDTEASDSLKELLIRLYQRLGEMATAINSKESAVYDTNEFVTGGVYFPNTMLTSETTQSPRQRQVIRKVVFFPGGLTIFGLNTQPHGIQFDANTIMTHIYGSATDPVNLRYTPLPYIASLLSGIPSLTTNISLWADATNVYIDTGGSDKRLFTICNVVIEYLKF